MKTELAKLIELQKTDSRIRQLKNAIDSVGQRRGEIEQEFDVRAFSIRELQNKRDTAHTEQISLTNEIADVRSQIERADRNLKASQNQKQYEAAMRESDTLNKRLMQLEEQTSTKQTAVSEAETELASRADEVSTIETERSSRLETFDGEFSSNQTEIDQAQAKRQEVFASLPPKLAAVYDRLIKRSKDGIAVAEVRREACSACYMRLRPQVMSNVKRGDSIITCESCSRILYYDAPESADSVEVAKM